MFPVEQSVSLGVWVCVCAQALSRKECSQDVPMETNGSRGASAGSGAQEMTLSGCRRPGPLR